jgi:uncharacterized integral membrane protein
VNGSARAGRLSFRDADRRFVAGRSSRRRSSSTMRSMPPRQRGCQPKEPTMSNQDRDLNERSHARRDPIEREARRRVGMKMGFYIHALVFVLVNVGMFALNFALGGTRWAHFPAYGWAVGLAIHGIVVFARVQGYRLRESMLEREIERLRSSGASGRA